MESWAWKNDMKDGFLIDVIDPMLTWSKCSIVNALVMLGFYLYF